MYAGGWSVLCPVSYTHMEGENKSQTMLNAAHYQLLASAKAVVLGHEIDPENKIGCMLVYPLCYAATCRPNCLLYTSETGLPLCSVW